jgi:predicted ATPase
MITSGLAACRPTGSTLFRPWHLSSLAKAYAELGQFDDAWRTIDGALVTLQATHETWYEAEVYRASGEIALLAPQSAIAKAEAAFERALAIARTQQARSCELRAAMSMARLWRDQSKRDKALELLAPIYAWFTEGFGTCDLREAKALLDELR